MSCKIFFHLVIIVWSKSVPIDDGTGTVPEKSTWMKKLVIFCGVFLVVAVLILVPIVRFEISIFIQGFINYFTGECLANDFPIKIS